ncbi:hypothetical protein M8C21_013596 [Ambrosia artemisiifolia]|uniref:Uncharacterized protein n=1 Tax=Ambrosia artemisiifolia TaxID=4212 RepID=A0AAD5CJP5_AMBAR|nr:hypothetical protein M8C21_013596 [Ambrosia artemisiifolia]
MGQDLELDFEKYCVVDGSPITVLLSPRNSKIKKKKVRKELRCRNEVLLDQSKEINLRRYRSASCRNVRPTLGVKEALKRGSVYQSSNEIGKMYKIDEKGNEGRKKIEFSRGDGLLPFEIFDSLCGSDEDESSLGSISSSFLEMSINSINKQEDKNFQSTPLHKSLSSRLEQPHSPTKLKTEYSKTTRFTPFKTIFDPFGKSKSQKSQNITLKKSLIHDVSEAGYNFNRLKKDSCSSIVSSSFSCSSPAHSNGVLKLVNKNRMPYFELTVKNSNDHLVAKTSKVENGNDWIYTFHSGQHKRRINGKDNKSKDLTIVGQMRVSCYLCTELVNADNLMVTEFVLYDLAQPRKSASHKSKESTDESKVDADLESAAIVIQFPSEKRESLKCNRGDVKNDDLFHFSQAKLEEIEPARVSVVIPSENHGLPSDESRGPSPLLDRWRLGGGCDCGGWDMGCPLIVLGNHNIQKEETLKQPVKLFLKGNKDNTPALTMKLTEEGQYSVDFHAHLTSLQAFSVCVAILHSTETSVSVAHDSHREMLQCDSLRVFVEDEVKHLIEVLVEEDKRKPDKNEIPPSFLVNPPFSPMSRA